MIERGLGGIRERQRSTGADDGSLVLAGDLDMSNEQLLTYALEMATSRSPGPFRLDLSRVEFLGAAGCRGLDQGTRKFRDGGGRVVLAAPGPAVERILRLAGVDLLKNALRVTVDLTGVTYLDSAAIRVLFEHAARVRLVLVLPAGGIVAPLVTLCGLGRVVTVRDAGTWRRS